MKALQLIYAITLLLLISCSTSKITVLEDSNGQFSLSDYQNFNFLEVEAEGKLEENYMERIELIKEQIIYHMKSRGLAYQPNQAELGINLGIMVEEKTQTRETNLATDPGTFNYIGQRRYTWKSETIDVGKYKKGTATIDLIDTKAQKAVWVGILEKIMEYDPEKTNQAIKTSIADLFEKIN